ncbi:MAG: chemotaxis protein CheD [Gemmatimonadaceae bacterium]
MNEIRVKVAECAVGQGEMVLSTVGLGSCVAIALFDAQTRVGGLAHILLPSETLSQDRRNQAKFPSGAVPLLLQRMSELGARVTRVRAKIVGGASMFTSLVPTGTIQIGERNVLATRHALERARVPIVGQDVGGGHGRNVFFHLADGRVEVRSLLKGDAVL